MSPASTAHPELSIVMPVYNEAENAERVLRQLAQAVRTPHELLVVYDHDADTTIPVVQRLQPEIPTVRLLRNDLGRGVLNAMKAGIAASRGSYVLITMGDGSDEVRVIDSMVEAARRGASVVAASRYMRGGKHVGGPIVKGFLSRAAGLSLHLLGVPVRDATNNFRLYDRAWLDSVKIESTGGFELALELTAKATMAGMPLSEVPTIWRDRSAGESRFELRAWLPRYLRWYLAVVRWRARRLVRG